MKLDDVGGGGSPVCQVNHTLDSRERGKGVLEGREYRAEMERKEKRCWRGDEKMAKPPFDKTRRLQSNESVKTGLHGGDQKSPRGPRLRSGREGGAR